MPAFVRQWRNFQPLVKSFTSGMEGAVEKSKDVSLSRKLRRNVWIRRAQKANAVKTKQADLKVLRDFFKYAGPKLVIFGSNIGVSLDPTKFVKLTVAPKDITALAADLNTKLAAKMTGGTVATAAKDKAFDALTAALNADANDIENVIGTDLEMLLATGYLPVSTNRVSGLLNRY